MDYEIWKKNRKGGEMKAMVQRHWKKKWKYGNKAMERKWRFIKTMREKKKKMAGN